jgi:hypothetical protein
MHHLTKVKLINNLNEKELQSNVDMSGSWHQQVKISFNYSSTKIVHIFISEDFPLS